MLKANPQLLMWMIFGEILAAIVYVMFTYSDPRDHGIRSVSAGLTMAYILATGICVVFLVLYLVKVQKVSADPDVLIDGRRLFVMVLVALALISAETLSLTIQGNESVGFMILTIIMKLALEGPYLMLGGAAGLWCNRMLERTS